MVLLAAAIVMIHIKSVTRPSSSKQETGFVKIARLQDHFFEDTLSKRAGSPAFSEGLDAGASRPCALRQSIRYRSGGHEPSSGGPEPGGFALQPETSVFELQSHE